MLGGESVRNGTEAEKGGEADRPMTVDEAILAVRDECPDTYARSYAGAAMWAATRYGTRGLRAQVQYALANMAQWRGERARQIKAVLRAYVDEKR